MLDSFKILDSYCKLDLFKLHYVTVKYQDMLVYARHWKEKKKNSPLFFADNFKDRFTVLILKYNSSQYSNQMCTTQKCSKDQRHKANYQIPTTSRLKHFLQIHFNIHSMKVWIITAMTLYLDSSSWIQKRQPHFSF